MQQPYFILVVAHSLHGRLRRIHVPYSVCYGILALALLGTISLAGIAASYARMFWKVSNYNTLRSEIDTIRTRYLRLQREHDEGKQQLATLQVLASEITVAYGIKRELAAKEPLSLEAKLVPTLHESIEDYNFLRNINFTSAMRNSYQTGSPIRSGIGLEDRPSLWPVQGKLTSFFGQRTDPFNGMGAFHSGLDISVPIGTPVVATAGGQVKFADTFSGYGRLLVLAHGNGMETYYGHMSRFNVIIGQRISRGEVVGWSGQTGRATSPHVHYEVRLSGSPVNPYTYLKSQSLLAEASKQEKKKELPF
ncbi:M23 family metallopeptidase [Bryobacter aggregatus]|uniref:M23 family metallopeptidase n=1 Tax=Bryobacter aggregatus TaxID=360054 RepID=UPI00068F130D|nr:M23 family metallopeptidase [Bryobacter aggregatus]